MTNESVFKKVNEQSEITNVIKTLGFNLISKGRDFKCLCPFHDDKSPSLSISTTKQFFKCFSCGESGNALTFVKKYLNISWVEATKKLGEIGNFEVPELKNMHKKEMTASEKRLIEINEAALQFWKYALKSSPSGLLKNFLEQRNLTKEDSEIFELGYASANSNLSDFLLQKDFTREEITNARLTTSGSGDKLRNFFNERLIFAIRDRFGNLVGFSGRTINNDEIKYLNSPETALFKKSELIYNWAQAIKSKNGREIILVEGFMDVIAVTKAGHPHVIGLMGTSLTREHEALIKSKYHAALLIPDADRAGRSAAIQTGLKLLKAGLSVDIFDLSESKCKDFDELVRANKYSGLNNLIALLEYKFLKMSDSCQGINEKGALLHEIGLELQFITNGVKRELYAKRIAEIAGVKEESFSIDAQKTRARLIEDLNYWKSDAVSTQKRLEAAELTIEKLEQEKKLLKKMVCPQPNLAEEIER